MKLSQGFQPQITGPRGNPPKLILKQRLGKASFRFTFIIIIIVSIRDKLAASDTTKERKHKYPGFETGDICRDVS